jgi:hypothetical protein
MTSRRHSRPRLSGVVDSCSAPSLGLDFDNHRYHSRHQSHRRAERAPLLAPACFGGTVGDRRRAYHSSSGRRPSHHHTSFDRVFYDRGNLEGDLFVDHKAVSQLGLGFGERCRRNTAGTISMGESPGNSGLVAWGIAWHTAYFRGRCSRLSGMAGALKSCQHEMTEAGDGPAGAVRFSTCTDTNSCRAGLARQAAASPV